MKLAIAAGCKQIKGREVKIKRGSRPSSLRFKSNPWALRYKDLLVVGIEWTETHARSAGKAALGAAVGGILTGGLGLLAGAAVGGRKRGASTAVLHLEGGQRLLVRATAKEYARLQSML